MEPLPPDVRKKILELNPDATLEQIDRYDQLLAARFRYRPPDDDTGEGFVDYPGQAELEKLHVTLFPAKVERAINPLRQARQDAKKWSGPGRSGDSGLSK